VTTNELEERAAAAASREPLVPGAGVVGRSDSSDAVPSPGRVTYTDYDDPFAFMQGSTGAPHLTRLSAHAWVGCGGDVYVLELLGRGHVRVQPVPAGEAVPDGPKYAAHYAPQALDWGTRQAMGVRRIIQRARPVLTAGSLEDAIRGCDLYAKQVLKGPLATGYSSSPHMYAPSC
jgi:ATP-dependent helicase IRC3